MPNKIKFYVKILSVMLIVSILPALFVFMYAKRLNFIYKPYFAEHLSVVFDDQNLEDETKAKIAGGKFDFILADIRQLQDQGERVAIIKYNSLNKDKKIESLLPNLKDVYLDIFSSKDIDQKNEAVFNNRFNLALPFEVKSYLTESDNLKIIYDRGGKTVEFVFSGQTLDVNNQPIKLNNFIAAKIFEVEPGSILKIGQTAVDLSGYQNDLSVQIGQILENNVAIYQPESSDLLTGNNGSFEQGLWAAEVADCSAYLPGEAEIAMSLSHDSAEGKNSLRLWSQNHFACAFKSFTLPAGAARIYKLFFNYKNIKGGKIQYYYSLRKPAGLVEEKFKSFEAPSSVWRQEEVIISPKESDAGSFDFYFYAPSDGSSEIDNLYDNLRLRSFVFAKEIDGQSLNLLGNHNLANWLNINLGKNTFKYQADAKNLLASGNYSFETGAWADAASDCSDYLGGEPQISLSLKNDAKDGSKSLELASKNHFACVFNSFPAELGNDKLYKFSFDYKSVLGNKVQYYYNMKTENGAEQDGFELIETKNSHWNKLETIISPNLSGIKDFVLYLYAPSSGAEEIINFYDNLKLEEFAPKEIYSYYFYAKNNNVVKPSVDSLEFAAFNIWKTKVVLNRVKDSFLLVYPEKFGQKWRLYPYLDQSAASRPGADLGKTPFLATFLQKPVSENLHFQVDNYSNGWWLDVSEICAENNLCQKNNDGTYNLTLVIENKFNKLLSVFLVCAFSLLILCSCYLIYERRK